MKKIKLGIVGAGRGVSLARDFLLLDGEIVALCDTHEKRLENAARALGGVPTYTDFEEFLSQEMDAVVLANYNIDIHNPAGTGTDIHYFQDGEYYSIPYRSLLPREYDNLLVAGRCISATHEAQAAVRVMPICACMGEAAGVAAAMTDDLTALDISTLQAKLCERGVVLHERDLAPIPTDNR